MEVQTDSVKKTTKPPSRATNKKPSTATVANRKAATPAPKKPATPAATKKKVPYRKPADRTLTALSSSSAAANQVVDTPPTSDDFATAFQRIDTAMDGIFVAPGTEQAAERDFREMGFDEQQKVLARMLVEYAEDEGFVRLCESVQGVWQRVAFGSG
jgi:hypothetical protein